MQRDYNTIAYKLSLIQHKCTFLALKTLMLHAKTSKVTDKKTSLSICHGDLSAALCDWSRIKEDHFPSSVSGSQC